MSYTNVTLPDQWSTNEQLRDRVALLEFQRHHLQLKIDEREKILNNIPKAIEEYGYVDLSDADGNFLMKYLRVQK